MEDGDDEFEDVAVAVVGVFLLRCPMRFMPPDIMLAKPNLSSRPLNRPSLLRGEADDLELALFWSEIDLLPPRPPLLESFLKAEGRVL